MSIDESAARRQFVIARSELCPVGALEELENGQEDAMKSYLELCNGRLGNLILLANLAL